MSHSSPPTSRDYDPNFPPSLDISPLAPLGIQHESTNQKEAIVKYGIAGRVWEASRPLVRYFTPALSNAFEPPCPIFDPASYSGDGRRILELGSGQGVASLHLANYLHPDDKLVLTDLENVIPLCDVSIDSWKKGKQAEGIQDLPDVRAQALGWGDDPSGVRALGPFDYIIICDLIYFPNLYPPLLRSLLELTEPAEPAPENQETFGPTIILSCKSCYPQFRVALTTDQSRTLNLEESFFDSFSRYFSLQPVILPPETSTANPQARIYICKRWRTTTEWALPDITRIMNGPEGGKGVVRGRDFGLVDALFAGLEWD